MIQIQFFWMPAVRSANYLRYARTLGADQHNNKSGDAFTIRDRTGRRLSLLQLVFRGLFLPFAEIGNGSLPTPEVHGSKFPGPQQGRGDNKGAEIFA